MDANELDAFFMQRCLELASQAAVVDEVPVGALIVKNGAIIAEAYNLRESRADPLAHAELLAISEAAAYLKAWRLLDCTLYVSLEPCAMCAGAIVNARISRLVFAASDPKAGCVGSLMNICAEQRLNHHPEIVSGVFANEAALLLRKFFSAKRTKK